MDGKGCIIIILILILLATTSTCTKMDDLLETVRLIETQQSVKE